MKITNFVLFAFLCLLTACNAQKSLECVRATRGNTGRRGKVPNEDRFKPNQGKDYFSLELKAKKDCTAEILSLIVNDNTGQCMLQPVFENNTTKMTMKAGESYYIRVEKDENAEIKQSTTIKGEGVLTVKINGKKMVLPIEKFVEILPQ